LDLEVELRHTDTGTSVLLFDEACETNHNISTIFDDAAPRRVCPPVELSATPDEVLSAFNGESAEGDWKLVVSDVKPGNVGYLNQWALLIPTEEPTPTPTFTVTPTPTPKVFDCNSPYSSAPSLSIPDASLTGSGSVSDSILISETDLIQDLNVFIDISHPYIVDLIVRLEHVDSGRIVILYDQTCGPGPYVDIFTVFDDEGAPFQVPGSCPPDDPNNPDQPWNPFNNLDFYEGDSIAGEWILTVTDANQGNSGTLNKWCLIATLSTPTPTPTATIFFDPQSPYCSEPNVLIPDATGATTGYVADTITIADHRTIADMDVFVSINHQDILDLSLSLEHVSSGLTVSLYTTGCTHETAIFTVFDDEGSPLSCPPIDPTAPVQTDNPFARLNSFDGMDLAGDWKLNVADLGVGRTGTLNKWCLIVTDATPAPSSTPTPTLTQPATPTPTPTQTGRPSPTATPTCANSADLNADGEFDARDLLELLRQIRGSRITPGYTSADLNCDSKVNDVDLLIFQRAWKP
jgi:subtilisin-like proprotein convertase family protein